MSQLKQACCEREIQRARRWAESAAKPWVDMIVRVRMLERPTYELTAAGLRMVSDGLPESAHETIRQCEQAIQHIHKQATKMAERGIGYRDVVR